MFDQYEYTWLLLLEDNNGKVDRGRQANRREVKYEKYYSFAREIHRELSPHYRISVTAMNTIAHRNMTSYLSSELVYHNAKNCKPTVGDSQGPIITSGKTALHQLTYSNI